MPEEISINSEKMREIEELERKLAEKKAAFEKEKLPAERREFEITMENLPEAPASPAPAQPAPATKTDADRKLEIAQDAKGIRNLDTARQIKVLITLAFEKGISYSIKVARSLNDAYLLDQLHDELVGELHDEFVKKGKLKEL